MPREPDQDALISCQLMISAHPEQPNNEAMLCLGQDEQETQKQ